MKHFKLHPRKQRFYHEYMVTCDATEAAIQAGYSFRSAKVTGHRLMQQPDVKAYIEELQKALREKYNVTRERILHELAIIAFSDMRDYYFPDNTLKPFIEIDSEKRRAISSMRSNRHTTKTATTSTVTIKLHDKINALLQLGKHLGFYDKNANTLVKGIIIKGLVPDDEESRSLDSKPTGTNE